MVRKVLREENSRTQLTIHTAPTTETKKLPQYVAALFATLSALVMGMCLSWTSSAIPMLLKLESHIPITTEEGSWIGSVLTLGACVGALPAGAVATRIGRKRILQFLSFPLFVSWILIAFGTNIWWLYAARIIAGLAIGAVSVAAPMYVAELAETGIRGTLGTFFQLQVTIGLLLGYILGGTVGDFKTLALISATVPAAFLILFSFMPETPSSLINRGDVDAARKSLQWFRGPNYDVDDEIQLIRDAIKETSHNKAKVSDLISTTETTRALIISLGLMVFQQFSGVNAVLFYAGGIFKDIGTELSPHVCAILIGVVQVLATFVSTILIDRTGRKLLLLISASVMSVCLGLLALYMYFTPATDVTGLAALPVASVALFIVVFSLGFGPIPWMMIGEIFPDKYKGAAGSVAAAGNWTAAFLVTKSFPTLVGLIGSGWTFGMFAGVCVLGAVFVGVVVPETKGKDIAEVLGLLGKADVKKGTIYDAVVLNVAHDKV